jgi:ribosome biogenesis GTP-binding protein YsxC/EngB
MQTRCPKKNMRLAVQRLSRACTAGSARGLARLAPARAGGSGTTDLHAILERDEALRAAYVGSLEDTVGDDVDADVVEDIEVQRLGRQRGAHTSRAAAARRSHACCASLVGVVLAADDPLPALLHPELPEVALVGRSNAGKSSLFNALTGAKGHRGAASVSHVPGWTSSLHFYELRENGKGPEEPLMTLVDLPGYGPAATKESMRTRWARTTKRYLREREQLACAFVVLDCTLGVTLDDERFLGVLDEARVECH